MLWKVTPDYIDYDLHDGSILVADTKEEAERFANEEFSNEHFDAAWKDGKPQVWTAWLIEIETLEKGILLSSYNAG